MVLNDERKFDNRQLKILLRQALPNSTGTGTGTGTRYALQSVVPGTRVVPEPVLV